MTPPILRLATSAAILIASASAYATPATTKAFEISGVLMEQAGPAARCPSQFGGTITGHGNSAQIGRVAFVATDCITPAGPLFNFSQGRFIIMTTSGDQIFAEYNGQFVPTGVGAKYIFSGATFQITGGSGKYHKASGGGALTGGQDMMTGMGDVKLSGQIHHKD
ncbi:hypothetical protein HHL21_11175 [Massilia sp. RP-1-19]|uniref:DUF3224 domain-containing protein n=1 Tax=Massilia polaris TaxID=2728846 RepID=A0A848HP98_9BURK|nr:hypothetical protein [Massilia polaris]NML61631.1 hypothetical protein [Massilia polaris]